VAGESNYKGLVKKNIPSGVGPQDGWIHVRTIDVPGVERCQVYDVDDDWEPKEASETALGSKHVDYNGIGWKVDWDQEDDLGRVPDKVLAERHIVSASAVARARMRRGIPAFNPPRIKRDIDWDAQPLGEVADQVIADDLGVDSTTVGKARRKLKIPSFYVDWDDPEINKHLGQVPDAKLAQMVGVTPSTVAKARNRRGISASKPKTKIDWDKEPLGKLTDADIARGLGVSPSLVTKNRIKRGIPRYTKPKPEEP